MSISIEVETPRLVLRQWLAADRQPFAALNADPSVTEYLLPLTGSGERRAGPGLAAGIDEHGWGFWAVEAPGVAPFIGFVGIKPLPPALPFAPGVEIGWRLARSRTGASGYASEAARAALKVGFEQVGLDEIVAFTVTGNLRSRAVMERLGMKADPQCFDHPAVPPGSPLRRHVLYRIGPPGLARARKMVTQARTPRTSRRRKRGGKRDGKGRYEVCRIAGVSFSASSSSPLTGCALASLLASRPTPGAALSARRWRLSFAPSLPASCRRIFRRNDPC